VTRILAFLGSLGVLGGSAHAELRLAGVFGDHMVLQRDVPVPVWGWAEAGESVTVKFAGQEKTAVADATGKWLVKLDALPASTAARALTVTGRSVVTKTDVLVGDVWLCSGQSNMVQPMRIPGNDYLQRRIREANNPQLRLIQVGDQFPEQPAADTKGDWFPAQSAAVGSWSAVGYLFGEKIQTELGVPVGLISSAVGGTPIEGWVSREVLQANPANEPYVKHNAAAAQRLPEALAKYENELAAFRQRFPDAQSLAAKNAARKTRGAPAVREPLPPEGAPRSQPQAAGAGNARAGCAKICRLREQPRADGAHGALQILPLQERRQPRDAVRHGSRPRRNEQPRRRARIRTHSQRTPRSVAELGEKNR
jgi:sialate O-acetylesterase